MIFKHLSNFVPISNVALMSHLFLLAVTFCRITIKPFVLLSLVSPFHLIKTILILLLYAFKNKHKAAQQNIHLDKAAVLFNLGAVHCQMGLSFDRSSIEGRRQGSHSFIAAAGAFAFLRVNVAMKASMGCSTTVDVSVKCAGMLERLMMAQAQDSGVCFGE